MMQSSPVSVTMRENIIIRRSEERRVGKECIR